MNVRELTDQEIYDILFYGADAPTKAERARIRRLVQAEKHRRHPPRRRAGHGMIDTRKDVAPAEPKVVETVITETVMREPTIEEAIAIVEAAGYIVEEPVPEQEPEPEAEPAVKKPRDDFVSDNSERITQVFNHYTKIYGEEPSVLQMEKYIDKVYEGAATWGGIISFDIGWKPK